MHHLLWQLERNGKPDESWQRHARARRLEFLDSGTTISAGAISVSTDANLGTGAITLAGGTLAITGGSFSSGKTVAISSGAIDVAAQLRFPAASAASAL